MLHIASAFNNGMIDNPMGDDGNDCNDAA